MHAVATEESGKEGKQRWCRPALCGTVAGRGREEVKTVIEHTERGLREAKQLDGGLNDFLDGDLRYRTMVWQLVAEYGVRRGSHDPHNQFGDGRLIEVGMNEADEDVVVTRDFEPGVRTTVLCDHGKSLQCERA